MKSKQFATYVKKNSTDDYDDDNKYQKVRDHCYYITPQNLEDLLIVFAI